MQKEVKEKPQYAIVASVQLPGVSDVEFEASLTELRELAKTLGFTVTRTFTQKRAGFDATAYLGVGKRQEIRHFVSGEADAETGDPTPSRRTPCTACPISSKAWTTKPTRSRPIRSTPFSSTTRFRRRRRATSKTRSAAR